MSAPVLGMRQYSSSQGRRTLPETRIFQHCQNCGFSRPFGTWPSSRGTSWLSNPLLPPPRFPFFKTNNLQINGHNYLWPPQLRTTAIKLINRGRLSVSPDCCVIRGAINKAVLLPCDILQMVWQHQLLLLQPLGSIHPHRAPRRGLSAKAHVGENRFSAIPFVPLPLFLAMCRLKD